MKKPENVTITFPQTSVDRFFREKWPHQKGKGIRMGQAFHQFMNLEKITSDDNKVFCDRLYEADGNKAKAIILSVLDKNN